MLDRADNVLLFLEQHTENLENKIALGMKSYLGWRELTYKGFISSGNSPLGFGLFFGSSSGGGINCSSKIAPF